MARQTPTEDDENRPEQAVLRNKSSKRDVWFRIAAPREFFDVLARHMAGFAEKFAVTVNQEGFRVATCDAENVIMADVWAYGSAFESWGVESNCEVSIPMSAAYDAIQYVDSDVVVFRVRRSTTDEGGLDYPRVLFEGPENDDRVAGVKTADAPSYKHKVTVPDDIDELERHEATVENGNDLREWAKAHGGNTAATIRAVAIAPPLESDRDPVVVLESSDDAMDPLVLCGDSTDVEFESDEPPTLAPGDVEADVGVPGKDHVVCDTTYSGQYVRDAFYKLRKGDATDVRYRIAFGDTVPITFEREIPDAPGFLKIRLAPQIDD